MPSLASHLLQYLQFCSWQHFGPSTFFKTDEYPWCCLCDILIGAYGHSFPLGEYDALPEQAFYMVGPIEEVVEKAAQMAKDLA